MKAPGRVPGTRATDGPAGRLWTTAYACDRCGEPVLHVEASPDFDEPHGLPAEWRWCDCGGSLILLGSPSAGLD